MAGGDYHDDDVDGDSDQDDDSDNDHGNNNCDHDDGRGKTIMRRNHLTVERFPGVRFNQLERSLVQLRVIISYQLS